MKRMLFVSASIACLAMAGLTAAGAADMDTADVVGQGDAGPVVADDGATLIRTKNGVTAALNMPTPLPGSYIYPPGNAFQPMVYVGHPEVFTGWIFIFNNPAGCSDPCNGDDLGDTPARGGAYNFAGHIVGGSTLNFAGHISVDETPFVGAPLDNPAGAEIHLAVAPHGMLLPDMLPTQITHPIGGPPQWWIAVFTP